MTSASVRAALIAFDCEESLWRILPVSVIAHGVTARRSLGDAVLTANGILSDENASCRLGRWPPCSALSAFRAHGCRRWTCLGYLRHSTEPVASCWPGGAFRTVRRYPRSRGHDACRCLGPALPARQPLRYRCEHGGKYRTCCLAPCRPIRGELFLYRKCHSDQRAFPHRPPAHAFSLDSPSYAVRVLG